MKKFYNLMAIIVSVIKPYPANIVLTENVVCFFTSAAYFKYTAEYCYHGSKHYEP